MVNIKTIQFNLIPGMHQSSNLIKFKLKDWIIVTLEWYRIKQTSLTDMAERFINIIYGS